MSGQSGPKRGKGSAGGPAPRPRPRPRLEGVEGAAGAGAPGRAAVTGGARSAAGSDRLRAYLELSRISNLPTCLTNVLVGTAIGAAGHAGAVGAVGGTVGVGGGGPVLGGAVPWFDVAATAVAVSLMYVSGMALNDVVDAPRDARERPGRPIPSGRIKRADAAMYAFVTMGLGLVLLLAAGAPAFAWGVALAAAIVLYDALHQRFAAAVVLMGVCRGLVYVVAAAAVTDHVGWTTTAALAGAMTLYVILLTLVARREHLADPRGVRAALALPVIVLLPLALVRPDAWWWPIIAGALMLLQLARAIRFLAPRASSPPDPKRAVMAFLAAICLVDAWFLTLLGAPILAAIALALFAVTTLAHRRISGT